ncbi:unnamed protein product [Urochloa humidicola]
MCRSLYLFFLEPALSFSPSVSPGSFFAWSSHPSCASCYIAPLPSSPAGCRAPLRPPDGATPPRPRRRAAECRRVLQTEPRRPRLRWWAAEHRRALPAEVHRLAAPSRRSHTGTAAAGLAAPPELAAQLLSVFFVCTKALLCLRLRTKDTSKMLTLISLVALDLPT